MEMQALELAIRDGLSANSYASSTPGSENYGRHMTPEEAVDFFTPS
jgi:hypothetical protein